MKRTIKNAQLRDTVTFIQTSESSGGDVTELEVVVMPGGINPAHFHKKYDETVHVLEGILLLTLSKRAKITLLQGDQYVIKAGQVHSLQNAADVKLKLRSIIIPANQGFESALRIMYGLANDGLYNAHKMPRNFVHLSVCSVMSDTRLPGLKSLLNPVFILLAHCARWTGITERLISKYCV
ncbi:cupin domain-containing protein [Mucilaginibacter polytrichastri]|uniref:cupin domain-containing protein n=1 Tax=Mucilaginibacter polytrichastri TaxID=1302689 RepID=UPI0008E17E5A|nr:cupin domain-containing protein [Mucilaginibacter polytrichastri]SFT24666.1 Cupin domain protein [Mucilaginibacter polytrichastri]